MKIFYVVFAILIILALFESWMYVLTHRPNILRKFSRRLQNSMGYLYIQGDRKVMQFLEGCGCYHPELGYTLKPGKFTFSEIEFSNEYQINSLGVRDAESSLVAPEIVLLGDSFALGWGVDQNQTFIKLLENKTNFKTLNTCVPSFGTVREMIMLRKVDRSRMKCLMIQYCADDYDENRLYYKNGNRPQIMRAETFENITKKYSRPKAYYPGKYIEMKIRKKFGEWILKPTKSDDDHSLSDVDLFLHVLKQNVDMLADIPLIVFELSGINQTHTFTEKLLEKTADPDQPPFIRNMIILDMIRHLKDRHYYVLDGHLTPEGHRIVADVLYQTLFRTGIFNNKESL